MGCITVQVQRVGTPIDATITRIGENIKVSASDISERLRVKCGIVCETMLGERYLNVTEGVFWLDVSNDFSVDVEVESNVTWRIV